MVRISAMVPQLRDISELYPGNPVACSMMTPVAQLWWLRPVINAARVGEQSAVVWKRLYFRPRLASLSMVGVGIGPPKVLAAPKPTSSVMMSRTLGASLGGLISLGKSGFEVMAMRSISPLNRASGLGS